MEDILAVCSSRLRMLSTKVEAHIEAEMAVDRLHSLCDGRAAACVASHGVRPSHHARHDDEANSLHGGREVACEA